MVLILKMAWKQGNDQEEISDIVKNALCTITRNEALAKMGQQVTQTNGPGEMAGIVSPLLLTQMQNKTPLDLIMQSAADMDGVDEECNSTSPTPGASGDVDGESSHESNRASPPPNSSPVGSVEHQPGATPSSPKIRSQVGQFGDAEKAYIKQMEERHEAEIASYASSINRSKESVLQQMSTRKRIATSRKPNAWNMQLSLFAAMCRQNGIQMTREELIKAVQTAREACKRHNLGEEGSELNAGDGDDSDILFKDDEDIRAAFERVEEQHADVHHRNGDVAAIMKGVVKELSQKVICASSRLAYPTEFQ